MKRNDSERLSEALQKILRHCEQPELVISQAFRDGGIDPLWPRFERAAMNQLEGGAAAASRYGIWANTVRDNLIEAMHFLDAGDGQSARSHLVRAANGLAAFSEVQALVDSLTESFSDA